MTITIGDGRRSKDCTKTPVIDLFFADNVIVCKRKPGHAMSCSVRHAVLQ